MTVNQRFEVFFPEKRPFFLENANTFNSQINLLFTRRIADPEIGVRLTGKVGDLAIGALLIDDEAPGKRAAAGSSLAGERARIGVLRSSLDIGRQSLLGLFVTDRELGEGHSRVAAIDGRLKLDDNWDTRFQVATSATRFEDGSTRHGPAYDVEVNRDGRQFSTHLHYRDVGRGFHTDLGFVPRTDLRDYHQRIAYRFRPEGETVISWGPRLFWDWLDDHDGTRLDWQLNPSLSVELPRRSFAEASYQDRRERLRPQDFAGLTSAIDFAPRTLGFGFGGSPFNWLTGNASFRTGRRINFVPPEGQLPSLERVLSLDVNLTLHPVNRLRVENRYLFTRLGERASGDRIFTNQIVRSRWSWQHDRRLTLRAILQLEDTVVDQRLTSLTQRRNLNADLLATYQINAWTAVYLGYNSNYRNRRLIDDEGGRRIDPIGTELANDSHQLFVKFSYLLRF